MGRSGFAMGTGKIDSTATDTGLGLTAVRLVECLSAARDRMTELPFTGIHSVSGQPEDLDAALRGTYRLRDELFRLSPPVDWWDEPYTRPGERGFFQNSLVFADPLLADPRFPEALPSLAALLIDWIEANPAEDPPHSHRYAWHDHAAAGRLVVMAYVLREGVRREALDSTSAGTLAGGVLEHIAYLLDQENYVASHNHGLFCDAAVALAARSLRPAPQAQAWAETAQRRFSAVLDHTMDQVDAIHLEHSPYYHWIIHGALARFAGADLFEKLELEELVARMERAGAWLVAPDGCLPPVGDTPYGQRPAPKTVAASEALSGMRIFPRAGYAAVWSGGSGLFVTAAHHPTAHKHADDGSFCLYEKRRALVLDAGDPGHDYESAQRRYGTSPAAHATICVDGFDWARGAPAYGSGIVAAAEHDGVYAILVRNPVATSAGGGARRALVYAPERFLLALDEVEAGAGCELARGIPIAPGLTAMSDSDDTVEIRDGDHVLARLVQVMGSDATPDRVELACGRLEPEMAGICFPTPDTSEPRYDIRLHGPAGHPRAFALILGDGAPANWEAPHLSWEDHDDRVDVEVIGVTASPLRVRLAEDSIGLA